MFRVGVPEEGLYEVVLCSEEKEKNGMQIWAEYSECDNQPFSLALH
jgi:hypothetical protein